MFGDIASTFKTNPLSIILGDNSCSSSSKCKLSITVYNNEPVYYYDDKAIASVFYTKCHWNQVNIETIYKTNTPIN